MLFMLLSCRVGYPPGASEETRGDGEKGVQNRGRGKRGGGRREGGNHLALWSLLADYPLACTEKEKNVFCLYRFLPSF